MKIAYRDVPETGMSVEAGLKSAWVQKMLEDLPGFKDFDFSSQISMMADGTCLLRGRFHGEMRATCDRCLSSFLLEVVDTDMACLIQQRVVKARGEDDEEGLDEVHLFEGPEFDVGQIVKEYIYLALPSKQICDTDCRGLCASCGQNFNEGECACPPPPKFGSDADRQNPFSRLKSLDNLQR